MGLPRGLAELKDDVHKLQTEDHLKVYRSARLVDEVDNMDTADYMDGLAVALW